MCDCKDSARLEMSEAHWAYKLIAGLITGGLIWAMVTDPRGRR